VSRARRLGRATLLVALVLLPAAACGVLPPAGPGGASPGAPPGQLPGQEVPTLPSPHIPYLGAPHPAYNSLPPTSGPHVPQTVAPGVYREEIPDELQVHALEHGHVLIQYSAATPAGEVRLLEAVARRDLRDVVVAPYGGLATGIALTAWGRLEYLDAVDPAAIEAFIRAFAGRYDHGWRPGRAPVAVAPPATTERATEEGVTGEPATGR
jgi:Protein of unknown function (DUF3105)